MLKELIIDDYGVSLSKKSERMVLKKQGKVIEEHAIKELEDLVVSNKCGMVSISLVEELIQNGTQIHLVDFKEEPFVTVYTPAHHGSVKARREQLLSYNDERGVFLSKEIVLTKIQNQMNTVRYYLKSRKDFPEAEELQHEIERMKFYISKVKEIKGSKIEDVRSTLVSCEAHAAKHYWKAVKIILGEKLDFSGRDRKSENPVNMMLNYGYAILRSRVASAVLRAGLEPYAGFIHVDRSGRVSFVLDVMELFRQSVVDRAVISLLTRGHQPKIEEKEDGSVFLDKSSLEMLRKYISNRLETREEYRNKDFMIRTIIQLQTRSIAAFFREDKEFKGYVSRW